MNFEAQEYSNQAVILRSALIGAACLLLLIMTSFKSVIPSIEKDILNKVSHTFIDHKLNNILVSASGQDIYLEGLVTNSTRETAFELASNVRGVRKVHDNFIITDSKNMNGSPQ